MLTNDHSRRSAAKACNLEDVPEPCTVAILVLLRTAEDAYARIHPLSVFPQLVTTNVIVRKPVATQFNTGSRVPAAVLDAFVALESEALAT